jgi:predicted transcriptional regulator
MVSNQEVEEFVKSKEQKGVTAKEIAKYFGINERNAQHHLKKLIDRGKIVREYDVDGTPFYLDIKHSKDRIIKELLKKEEKPPRKNIVEKKVIERIITQFNSSKSSRIKSTLAGKLYELSERKIVWHPEIIDFLRGNIPKVDKQTRVSLIKLLFKIIETSAELNDSAMEREIVTKINTKKFLDVLIKVVKDNEEIDTSRFYASLILIAFNTENALNTLFYVLKKGKIFVHDEAFIGLFLLLDKRLPEDKKDNIFNNCKQIVEGNYNDNIKQLANAILSRTGLDT